MYVIFSKQIGAFKINGNVQVLKILRKHDLTYSLRPCKLGMSIVR